MINKTNIYGDYKICVKCKNHADVIEGTKNYCIECWYLHINGKSIKEADHEIKEEERFKKKPKEKIMNKERSSADILKYGELIDYNSKEVNFYLKDHYKKREKE
tara:strand:+ start:716 stop:1027 length:312 start_codon:yes stop_codon:yes gene_type:complete